MMKFIKKPVEVEAMQFDGTMESAIELQRWSERYALPGFGDGNLIVRTLNGEVIATKGDWIIKGIKGEFYPCAPDIFEKSYESKTEPS